MLRPINSLSSSNKDNDSFDLLYCKQDAVRESAAKFGDYFFDFLFIYFELANILSRNNHRLQSTLQGIYAIDQHVKRKWDVFQNKCNK